MEKITYFILSAIIHCVGIQAAVAQVRENSDRPAIVSAMTAWGGSSVAEAASGIMNAPSSAVSSPTSALDSHTLASTASADALSALAQPAADFGSLTSGLLSDDAARASTQSSGAMKVNNSVLVPVALAFHASGRRATAPASGTMEPVMPARGARSFGALDQRRPARKR